MRGGSFRDSRFSIPARHGSDDAMARREKAAARVAGEIVQTIYEEGLTPGSHYLSETDALARHGVSRATFREALRFLEFQGVVRVRAGPGGGTIVERPEWPNLTSTFALLLQFADASLGDVLEARTAIEPEMAALAARNATAGQIERLHVLLTEAEAVIEDAVAFGTAYRTFWSMVAAATGNALTAMLWPALRALVDSGGFSPDLEYRRVLTTRMRTLLAAVERHDEAGAQALVRHLDIEFSGRLRTLYPQRIGRTIAWTDVLD